MRLAQDRRGAYSFVRLRGGHPDVGEHDVGVMALDCAQKRVKIAACGHQGDIGLSREQLLEPLANDKAVFREGNADRHARNHRWSSGPMRVVLAYRNMGASALASVRRRARCFDRLMEPASTAALPAAHRFRRRDAAGCRPPVRPRGLVARPRLVRRLLEARDAPFVLVVAPAGYGKTTLLSEWAACDGRQFAWIDLGAGDHDSDRLLAAVKRTVHDGQPPTVLVVDNAHLVTTPGTFEALDERARSMPRGSQLALASRAEPELPVGSLRAHRRVFELRTGDMAMTRSEARALLAAAGIRLPSDGLDTLMRRTEGWPAALYLRDELVARLEPDHVAFLLRTSILGTLSGSLCDAVLDEGGSARRLGELARSNVLLVRLDRGGRAYRHHPLFREMLRAELRRLDPRREPQLHARASAWYEQHGDMDSAIQHAVAAGDPQQSGELLWRHASSYIGHGGNEALQSWLNRFTDKQLADIPPLAVAAATSRLAGGEGAQVRHWVSAAARSLPRHPSTSRRPLDGAVVLLRAVVAEQGLAQMGRDAARACALSSDDAGTRSFAHLLAGAAQHLTGARSRARTALDEGARSSAVVAPHVQALCLTQLSLLEMDEEDWNAATTLSERARARVEGCGLADYPIVALVYAVSALARSHGGRVEHAHRDLRTATRLTASLVDFVPWYEAETRVTLARASLGLSDVAGARSLLADAARLVRRI